MPPIDISVCAAALREVTNQIADTQRPDVNQPLKELIVWVRNLSSQTRGTLESILSAHFPGVRWPDEEDVSHASNDSYWIFDPIDGAYHFLQGLALWSSSLALVVNGQIELGLVYDPALKEMFAARRGQHTTLNGRHVTVSTKQQLATSVLGTAVPPIAQVGKDEHARALSLFAAMAPNVFVMRQMGSASLQLAYVAAGRLEGYVEVGQDATDWLAGSLLVTEAGGVVSDIQGANFHVRAASIVATPTRLHSAIIELASNAVSD